MRTNIKPENRRLLEAVEYIDENIILGVLSELRMPKEKHIEPLLTWRTPLKHWKSIAVLAACTVLLAFAAPTASFISQVISNYSSVAGGNAGAGNDKYSDYDPYKNSAVFDYPIDMSAEDVYADLLAGGWTVYENGKKVAGEDLWSEFYQKVRDKEPASFCQAWYITTGYRSDHLPSEVEPDGMPCLELMEVVYDGETYHYSFRYMHPSLSIDDSDIREYKYLKLSKKMNQNERQYYFLTNDPKLEYWSPFYSFSAPDYKTIYYKNK